MKVRWTASARQDRIEIRNYIAAENPAAAVRMDRLFSNAAARLAAHPKIGKAGKIPGTRELIPHESYRLVYEIDGDAVWILVLTHTARQWPPVYG
jgi:addiction module RelE/StbE family toxin